MSQSEENDLSTKWGLVGGWLLGGPRKSSTRRHAGLSRDLSSEAKHCAQPAQKAGVGKGCGFGSTKTGLEATP